MRAPNAFLLGAVLASGLYAASPLPATDTAVRVITHRSRVVHLTESEVRAIYLKQKLFWDDGRPIVAINLEAGSAARELFSEKVFGQSSTRAASYWNQRYFEAGEFPPATLASEEAVLRFVATNENAIGYLVADEPTDDVTVALVLR